MSYKVIHAFSDSQDFRHVYNVGDVFPRKGMKVTPERLKELSGKNNKQKKPLIKEIAGVEKSTSDFSQHMNPPEEPKSYTKTEINRMSTAELRTFATEQGIDGAKDMTGSELKRVLVQKLGL